jgi:hypothetical protein
VIALGTSRDKAAWSIEEEDDLAAVRAERPMMASPRLGWPVLVRRAARARQQIGYVGQRWAL